MGEDRELQLHIRASSAPSTQPQPSSRPKKWRLWLLLLMNAVITLSGGTFATLLGRFYFQHGGSSLWMSTLVPSCGSPLILILMMVLPSTARRRPSASILAATFIAIGVLGAGDNLMYSYGLRYLPVSTFSLLSATQLAFNAVFAYFLNSQKFTPYIFNSVILLTISAVLLGVDSEGGSAVSSNYPLGLTLTLGASALLGLLLSLTQLTIQKVLKADKLASVVEILFWTGLVSSSVSVVGLFASGEWRGIHAEFVGFDRGRFSYVMTLIWIALGWTIGSVGSIALIFMVSSLFSNVIATVGVPLVPIFAVVFFHERMNGVKVVALVIALLGFVNYMYQHYLDVLKDQKALKNEESLIEARHDQSAKDSIDE